MEHLILLISLVTIIMRLLLLLQVVELNAPMVDALMKMRAAVDSKELLEPQLTFA